MEQRYKKDFLINLSFALVIGIIIFISARFLFKYLLPFVIAGVVAWVVQAPAGFVSRKFKIKKSLCAAIISLITFILTAGILFFTVYRLGIGVRGLFEDFSDILSELSRLVDRLRVKITSMFTEISPDFAQTANKISSDMLDGIILKITTFFSSFAANFAKNIPSFLFSLVVTLVASCYIAKDYDILIRFLRGCCGERVYSKILIIKEIFSESVLKILKGYAILMLITFCELLIGFYFLKIRYSLVLAVAISLIDLLPVFGTGTILIPWALAELALGSGRGFGLLILYIFITIARNFLEPKIIGNQIGINPLFTLVAMFSGLKLLGFWGLIIFPVALIIIIKYYKNEMELEKQN